METRDLFAGMYPIYIVRFRYRQVVLPHNRIPDFQISPDRAAAWNYLDTEIENISPGYIEILKCRTNLTVALAGVDIQENRLSGIFFAEQFELIFQNPLLPIITINSYT